LTHSEGNRRVINGNSIKPYSESRRLLLDVTADICRLVGMEKAYREAGGYA
jgi:hypothetical protein